MNYKIIFKSRPLRNKILEFFRFIPDNIMLKIQYYIKIGRKLNLNNPVSFTEKIQWYKLNYKNKDMPRCVDKYDVRDYINEKGLGNILNDCYGCYESYEDINFDNLPNEFVIKDTLGSGGNSVVLCKDKSKINYIELKKTLDGWVSTRIIKGGGREWPYYSGKKHRIVVERFLVDDNEDLPDYKFLCFDGKCRFTIIRVDYAKELSDEDLKMAFLDENDNVVDVKTDYCSKIDRKIVLPDNFAEMKYVAECLSKDFPHVRIDLYNVKGQIIFGEMTFFNDSGYTKFDPQSFDYLMGTYFNI